MFLHKSHFEEAGFPPDSAELAAKIANNVIDQSCQPIYGEYLQNNEAHNFGTSKKRTDTHVALLLGVALMGNLKPHSAPVALERPSKIDIEKMQSDRIKQLERQLQMERGQK